MTCIHGDANETQSEMSEILESHRHDVAIDGSTMIAVVMRSGPTVVLGSSFLWDATMWAPQIQGTGVELLLIVPDL